MDEATTMASQKAVVGLRIVYPVYYLTEDHHHYYRRNREKMATREYWKQKFG